MAECGYEQKELAGIVLRARNGSQADMEDLILRFQDRVAGFVYTMVHDREVIEDICQNVFLKMISGLAKLKNVESFEPWLFRIARNACTDFIRRQRIKRLFVPLAKEHEEMAPVTPSCDSRLDKFHSALLEMAPAQKELILLLADNDWSYEELAKITGSSLSAIRTRLFRAREFLRRRMAHGD